MPSTISGAGARQSTPNYPNTSEGKPLPKTPPSTPTDSASMSSLTVHPPTSPEPSEPQRSILGPQSRPKWAVEASASSASQKALPALPQDELTVMPSLNRHPTASDTSTAASPLQSSQPAWLTEPYKGSASRREMQPRLPLRSSASTPALRSPQSVKEGVRKTQTYGGAPETGNESKPRRAFSISRLKKNASTRGQNEDEKPPANATTIAAREEVKQQQIKARQMVEHDSKMRENAKKIIIEKKINEMIDRAMAQNSSKLKTLREGSIKGRIARAANGRERQEKLEMQEGFTRAQWREKVLRKHGMPTVTKKDDLASQLRTPQALKTAAQKEKLAGDDALQALRRENAARVRYDPWDNPDDIATDKDYEKELRQQEIEKQEDGAGNA